MTLSIIDHPLAKNCLAELRDKNTKHHAYKRLSSSLAILIALSATADLTTKKTKVSTPMCETTVEVIEQSIVLVPILRAGLSMLSPIQDLFPHARVGFIGLQRSDQELAPEKYYLNVPKVKDATVLLLDPMIATGGSILSAVKLLKDLGYNKIKILAFVSAPEGIQLLEKEHPELDIYTAALDERLDHHQYIIPGLGDFGDRLFGTSVLKSN